MSIAFRASCDAKKSVYSMFDTLQCNVMHCVALQDMILFNPTECLTNASVATAMGVNIMVNTMYKSVQEPSNTGQYVSCTVYNIVFLTAQSYNASQLPCQ